MKAKGIRIIEEKETATIYLYGQIRRRNIWDDEYDADFISADGVASALEQTKGKSLKVHINSLGGDVFESIAICNILKERKDNLEIFIDAVAGSGASIIAMAGKTVKMASNSMMMVHPASSYAAGNAKELRKIADDLEKIDISVMETYKPRFKGTEQDLKDIFEAETWLTASECLAFGFCDYIIDDGEEGPKVENKVKNLFEKLRDESLEKEKTIINDSKKKAADKNLFKHFA